MSGRMWIHIDDYYAGTDRAGVVHAITASHFGQVRKARRERRTRRKTYDALCGKRFVRMMVHEAVDQDGEVIGVSTAGWPPPVRKLADDDKTRCRECWKKTGSKRPHSLWKSLRSPA